MSISIPTTDSLSVKEAFGSWPSEVTLWKTFIEDELDSLSKKRTGSALKSDQRIKNGRKILPSSTILKIK
jgi:hypothetical protein